MLLSLHHGTLRAPIRQAQQSRGDKLESKHHISAFCCAPPNLCLTLAARLCCDPYHFIARAYPAPQRRGQGSRVSLGRIYDRINHCESAHPWARRDRVGTSAPFAFVLRWSR
jgi:hypothetical protein